MMAAIQDIDELLGKGYAKSHPELIAAYMQTSAADLGAAVIARSVETLSERLNASLSGLVENVRSDHPLQGETFHGLTEALNAIAQAIDDHKGKR